MSQFPRINLRICVYVCIHKHPRTHTLVLFLWALIRHAFSSAVSRAETVTESLRGERGRLMPPDSLTGTNPTTAGPSTQGNALASSRTARGLKGNWFPKANGGMSKTRELPCSSGTFSQTDPPSPPEAAPHNAPSSPNSGLGATLNNNKQKKGTRCPCRPGAPRIRGCVRSQRRAQGRQAVLLDIHPMAGRLRADALLGSRD